MMGAGHAKAAYALWGSLDPQPKHVLVFMALTATDEDEPPCYWGGWDTLACGALGRKQYDRAAKDAVQRAIKTLIERGAIVEIEPSAPRRNAKYALRLSIERDALSDTRSASNRTRSASLTGRAQRANGTRSASQRDALTASPRKKRTEKD